MFILKLKITRIENLFQSACKNTIFLQATAVCFFWNIIVTLFEVVRLIGTKQHLT
jgi:hypothetical protein